MSKMRFLTIMLALLIAPFVLLTTGCDDDDDDARLNKDKTVVVG
ncbi:MAG: hypothetical protein ACT4NX_05225 [Deltaproteobacteria bacterium]